LRRTERRRAWLSGLEKKGVAVFGSKKKDKFGERGAPTVELRLGWEWETEQKMGGTGLKGGGVAHIEKRTEKDQV